MWTLTLPLLTEQTLRYTKFINFEEKNFGEII